MMPTPQCWCSNSSPMNRSALVRVASVARRRACQSTCRLTCAGGIHPRLFGEIVVARRLAGSAALRIANLGVIDPKELYSDSKTPIGEPLTIHHASHGLEFTAIRAEHKTLVLFLGPQRKKARTDRAHVFGGSALGGRRVAEADDFYGDRPPSSFLNSSRTHRHVLIDRPSWISIHRAGLGVGIHGEALVRLTLSIFDRQTWRA